MLLKPFSMMHKQTGGGGGTTPVAVTLDGANDYIERGSALTGEADSQYVMMYAKFASTDDYGALMFGASNYFSMFLDGNGVTVILKDSGGTTLVEVTTDGTPDLNDGSTYEVMVSYDGNAGTLQVYIDGVADGATPGTLTTGTVDITRGNYSIGAQTNGAQKFAGDITRVAMWHGAALDLSSSGNRDDLADPDATPSGATVLFDCYTETDITAFDNQSGTGVFEQRNGAF